MSYLKNEKLMLTTLKNMSKYNLDDKKFFILDFYKNNYSDKSLAYITIFEFSLRFEMSDEEVEDLFLDVCGRIRKEKINNIFDE